jgi:hypothetical protein
VDDAKADFALANRIFHLFLLPLAFLFVSLFALITAIMFRGPIAGEDWTKF